MDASNGIRFDKKYLRAFQDEAHRAIYSTARIYLRSELADADYCQEAVTGIQRDAAWMCCGFHFFLYGSKVYALFDGDERMSFGGHALEWVEQFGYSQHKPGDMTEDAWTHRRSAWNTVALQPEAWQMRLRWKVLETHHLYFILRDLMIERRKSCPSRRESTDFPTTSGIPTS
jgi:hypothetical protein